MEQTARVTFRKRRDTYGTCYWNILLNGKSIRRAWITEAFMSNGTNVVQVFVPYYDEQVIIPTPHETTSLKIAKQLLVEYVNKHHNPAR